MRACMYICKCINIYICVYTWIKCTCTLLSCFFWIVNAIYLDIEILSIKFWFLKPTKYSKSFTNIMLLLFNTKIKTETVESKLAILKNVRYIIRITWSYASSMNELVTMFKTGNTWLIRNHVESYTANLDLLHKYFCRHFARGRCLLSAFVYACVYIFIYAYIYTHTCTHNTYIHTHINYENGNCIDIYTWTYICIKAICEHVYFDSYTFNGSMNRYPLKKFTI